MLSTIDQIRHVERISLQQHIEDTRARKIHVYAAICLCAAVFEAFVTLKARALTLPPHE